MNEEYGQAEELEHKLIEIEIEIAEIDDEIVECVEHGEHYNKLIEVKRQQHINNLKAKKRSLKGQYKRVDGKINDCYNKYGG